MQALDELDPTVRIRELKKDRVNFVLENVDLAYGRFIPFANVISNWHSQIRQFFTEGYDG